MSLQWKIAAGFLYSEVFLLFLFCLPFIRPSRWSKIFNSSIVQKIFSYGNWYFNAFIGIQVIFFFDSIREILKYQRAEDVDLKNNPQAEIQYMMRLFRAQRNLYIAGFTLFLLFVLRRLITMLLKQANLEATSTASMSQAQNISDHCQKVMEDNEKLTLRILAMKKKDGSNEKEEEKEDESKKEVENEKEREEEKGDTVGYDEVDKESEITNLKTEIEKVQKECDEKDQELKKIQKDFEALTKQAEGVNREYDRLLEEHDKTQKLLMKMTEAPEDEEENKKDN